MIKTEIYRDFVISWEEPPQTFVGYAVNVASEKPELLRLINGPQVMPPEKDLAAAIQHAKKFVDRALAA